MIAGIRCLALCTGVLVCTGAFAAENHADARIKYQRDRSACLQGDTAQDRNTCLREAGAALAEAKRGGLSSSASLEANLTARCDKHQVAADREDCMRRMRGEGSVSGSVEGGGVLRELTTIVPAK